MEMLLPALAISGLTFGPYVGRLAYLNHRQARWMANAETVPTSEVRPSMEAEVGGTVAEDAETFPSPVSGTPAVCCVWRVDEWSERGSMSLWRPVATGVRSRPFEVDDGAGRQRVTVGTHSYDLSSLRGLGRVLFGKQDAVQVGVVRDGLTLDLTNWSDVLEVPPDEEPPEAIRRFVEETDAVAPASDSITNVLDVGKQHGRRRYREALLKPGDDCYALGTTDAAGTLTPETDDLLVGSGDEAAVRARKQKRARRGGAVAVGAVLLGVAAVAMML